MPGIQFASLLVLLLVVAFTILGTSQLLRIVKQSRNLNASHRSRLLHLLGKEDDERDGANKIILLGFFHPYCNAGGGGERVLFEAIAHHQRSNPNIISIVYTGDVGSQYSLRKGTSQHGRLTNEEGKPFISKEDILQRCKSRFGLTLSPTSVHFLPLRSRALVSDSYWKRLTLLGQSFGSTVLAAEAMQEVIPDIFVDTMGYAFSYPTVRLFSPRISIGSYTHYPTISTDMLRRVQNRETGHTNNASVTSSWLKSNLKLGYYQMFARLYSFSLRQADTMVVNGSWTRSHIQSFFSPKSRSKVRIIFPPCDTKSLCSLPLTGRSNFKIVSLAQFRPEKEQRVQVEMLKNLFDINHAYRDGDDRKGIGRVTLTLMGSSRNQGDESRIEELKDLASQLKVQDNVEFLVNAPWAEIIAKLSTAGIGLSTMIDEHFGMNVVEFMASGVITLSHASAGPLLDIAVPVDDRPTGFHASTPREFAEKLKMILRLPHEESLEIRQRARTRAREVFSSEEFARRWNEDMWEGLETKLRRRREDQQKQR